MKMIIYKNPKELESKNWLVKQLIKQKEISK